MAWGRDVAFPEMAQWEKEPMTSKYHRSRILHDNSSRALHGFTSSLSLTFWPPSPPLHPTLFLSTVGPVIFPSAWNALPEELMVSSSATEAHVVSNAGRSWLPYFKVFSPSSFLALSSYSILFPLMNVSFFVVFCFIYLFFHVLIQYTLRGRTGSFMSCSSQYAQNLDRYLICSRCSLIIE